MSDLGRKVKGGPLSIVIVSLGQISLISIMSMASTDLKNQLFKVSPIYMHWEINLTLP